MHPSLKCLSHRPWALPAGPWIMAQNWHDLLFAHWPVSAEAVRRVVPRELELDCFEGQHWIGVVPFRMEGVRLRGTPAVPALSAFPELNVRTYVTAGGKPGVWFFSLDAASRVAVEMARVWFHLPYFRARMSLEPNGHEVNYLKLPMLARGRVFLRSAGRWNIFSPKGIACTPGGRMERSCAAKYITRLGNYGEHGHKFVRTR